jgi:peptide/nickel transport system permease protein
VTQTSVRPIAQARPAVPVIVRSPGRAALLRLRRDRVAVVSGVVLLALVAAGVGAPLWSALYGQDAVTFHLDLLSPYDAMPLGVNGGISGAHWLGVEPSTGRDLLMQVLFGLRTSLVIGFTAGVLATALGTVVGIVAGYATGWLSGLITWITDLVLTFPLVIFALAAVPVLTNRFFKDVPQPPAWFPFTLVIVILVVFGWPYPARVVRGQVMGLREREFVHAARAAGAGTGHVLFRQILPNLWSPIIVLVSVTIPSFIAGETGLSFIGLGVTEPVPDLGRTILNGNNYLQADPEFALIPATSLLLLVLAFNLLGDSIRDALDPR